MDTTWSKDFALRTPLVDTTWSEDFVVGPSLGASIVSGGLTVKTPFAGRTTS